MTEPTATTTRHGAPIWLAAVIAFVALIVGVVAVLVVRGGDDSSDGAATTTSAPAAQELVLEPAGVAGRDPFSASVAIYEKPLAADATLASTSTAQGDTPGLYGGTQDQKVCDAEALVSFLEENPDKAAAWAGVLDITPGAIRDYVDQLTPVILRVDTRVTNHGFADGVATPRQSVLQAGTAVMVDSYGIPRVRCSCGNPLTEPAPLGGSLTAAIDTGSIVLLGQPWTDWNPQLVVIVDANVIVTQFILWDVINGGTFPVQIGGAPVTTTTTTTQPPTTTTTSPPPTTAAPVDPRRDDDCRNDPPLTPEEEAESSGDVVCDPNTGQLLCYRADNTLSPCRQS